jgi:hypothetical protein
MSLKLNFHFMSIATRQFIVKILIFTLIIYAVAEVLFTTVLKIWYFSAFPYLLLLIAVITAIGHLLIVKAAAQNMRRFTTAFMASVTLKLIVYLIFILVYLLIDRTHVIPFVSTFLAFYILFTIFEVTQVLAIVKN